MLKHKKHNNNAIKSKMDNKNLLNKIKKTLFLQRLYFRRSQIGKLKSQVLSVIFAVISLQRRNQWKTTREGVQEKSIQTI